MRKILFVDDDPLVLQGIVRSLHGLRSEWVIETASGGEEALKKLEADNFDVIVSDMRMPGMDGAALLRAVKERHPQVLRFVLSGQCDESTMLRSVSSAHQFLSKPCDALELRTKLKQTFAVSELLGNVRLKQLVSQLKSLPSPPIVFTRIMALLNSETSSSEQVAEIVSHDLAMCAKILQLANSPLFANRAEISNAVQAVKFLGFKTVRSLALSASLFTRMETTVTPASLLEDVRRNSLRTGIFARAIARCEKRDEEFQDYCFTSGLVHDVGRLIVATLFPDGSGESPTADSSPAIEPGCGHGPIGAYLLGIWGLPHLIVESVAWHDNPGASSIDYFHPLVAVHVAEAIAEQPADESGPPAAIDHAFLQEVGVADKLESWLSAIKELKHSNLEVVMS